MKTSAPNRGYSADKDQLITRLNRIEGQVRGLHGMVEDDRWCPDIVLQIAAVTAALDKSPSDSPRDTSSIAWMRGPTTPSATNVLARLARRSSLTPLITARIGFTSRATAAASNGYSQVRSPNALTSNPSSDPSRLIYAAISTYSWLAIAWAS